MDFLVKIHPLSTKFIQKFKSYSFLNAHKIQNACGISFKTTFYFGGCYYCAMSY